MFVLRPYQKEAVDLAVAHLKSPVTLPAVMMLPTGCHTAGHKILMFDGSLKNVEDIKKGDKLMGPDSTERTVLKPIKGFGKIYKVKPNRGEIFYVNDEHILHLHRTGINRFKTIRNYVSDQDRYYPPTVNISVKDWLKWAKSRKHLYKLVKTGVEFNPQNTATLPYYIGLWIGDGDSLNPSITNVDIEVIDYLKKLCDEENLKFEYKSSKRCKITTGHTWTRSAAKKNLLLRTLKHYNLISNKHIPQEYLSAKRESRLQLLAGLIDSDGHYSKKTNNYSLGLSKKHIAESVSYLARSLGLHATVSYKKSTCTNCKKPEKIRPTWVVYIGGEDVKYIPCKIKRKQPNGNVTQRNSLRQGFHVEYHKRADFYGFLLDKDHLYVDQNFYIHHNSGKSLVIANIVKRLNAPVIVFQPSKEILEQNLHKYLSYGEMASVYSASVGRKDIGHVTFAMIGSVYKKPELFVQFKYIIIDECHKVSAETKKVKGQAEASKGGMYKEFLKFVGTHKILGLTATPYRLAANSLGAELRFLTRTRPAIFKSLLYFVQNKTLFDEGFLCPLIYHQLKNFDRTKIARNTKGTDYDEEALKQYYKDINFIEGVTKVVQRLVDRGDRKHILVFTQFIEEAKNVAANIPGATYITGKTPKREREHMLKDFKCGKIKVMVNVGVLTIGFDFPELDTLVIARPTLSLTLFYQMVGRVLRPHALKAAGMVIDMCGNINFFGRIEDLKLMDADTRTPYIKGTHGQLTNVPLARDLSIYK